MKPTPPPATIILPPVDSADYFSEKPVTPVKSGDSTMGLSCKAGAVFQAGDQIILGMGTATVEVMTIKELSMDPSCMDDAGELAGVDGGLAKDELLLAPLELIQMQQVTA